MGRPIMGIPTDVPNEKLEEQFRKSAPSVLYKYRAWREFGKNSLANSQIWYTNPKDLNDNVDIRLAYTFDSNEVNSPKFLARLSKEFPRMTNLIPGTLDYVAALMDFYDHIRRDPQAWFSKNQQDLRDGPIYEQLGLFSTTSQPLEKLMWAHYADSHRGYVIGYDPYILFRTKAASCGSVHYIKEPLKFSFIDGGGMENIDHFIKMIDWEYEKEYRFLTFVSSNNERLVQLPIDATIEVILGLKASMADQEEIIEILKRVYLSRVKLMRIKEDNIGNFCLDKIYY